MDLLDLGTKSYSETWELQKQLVEKRAAGLIDDTLLFVEHPAVYTVGRAGHSSTDENPSAVHHAPSEIKVRRLGSVPVVEVERGGKLTFHGPGQLVGYPIFALPHHDLRRYLRDLERSLMLVLAEQTMLPARPCPETLLLEPGQLQTGVWIRDKKIASIGIAVKRWITYHGFALNLSTDLRYFDAVEPCGFPGSIMTSVATEMGSDADITVISANIKRELTQRLREVSQAYQAEAKAPMATGHPAELATPPSPAPTT